MDAVTAIIVVGLVTCYVTIPLLVFVHELGHAFAVMRVGRSPIVIIGRQPALIRFQLGRLELRIDPRLNLLNYHRADIRKVGRSTDLGLCRYDPQNLSSAQVRSIVRAGPIAMIAAGVVSAIAAVLFGSSDSVGFWIFAVASLLALAEAAAANLISRRVKRPAETSAAITQLGS